MSERMTDIKITENSENPTRKSGKYQLGGTEKSPGISARKISQRGADRTSEAILMMSQVCDLLSMAPNA